jgi:UDP-GlcNAc:undecaprenyl-phosphate GlcNAc-1-phosphate transferase
MARIGLSVRRSVIYLYVWTLMLAGLALALRFVPYSNHHGGLSVGWSLVLAAYGLLVVIASIYLVYMLEILKFRGRAAWLASRRTAATEPASQVSTLQTEEPPRAASGSRSG